MTDTFGPFRLLARLGRGGMAETFVAERVGPVGFAKRVCLKRILADHGTDADFVRLFQNEARLAANLDHPNIVTTFDFGEVEGTWWMSMQLVDGLDLRSLLAKLRARREPLPREVALYIVREVAQALDYAHTLTVDGSPAHVVHRDVSPSNVLVSYEGAVKLADFGIAKAATSDLRTQTGVMRGKPSYMAPEQALAKPVDGRADLFALGVVLFELLAGSRPFDVANNDVATIQNVIGGRRKDLLALAPNVPDSIVALVDGLLDPDLELRTSAASEVAATFQRDIPLPPDVSRTLGALVRSVHPPEPILAGGLTVRDGKPPAVVTVTPETAAEGARDVEAPATTPMTSSTSGRRTTRATLGVVAGVVIVASLAAVASLRTIAVTPAATPTTTQAHATSREAAREAPPEPVASPPTTVEAPAVEAADAPPSEPMATERATPVRATTRTRATSPEAPPPPHDEAAPEPATLVVVVPPWGEVRINGRSAGQSPITEQLAPGRYVIEGRRDLERAEQVITLAPGERREVVLLPRAP